MADSLEIKCVRRYASTELLDRASSTKRFCSWARVLVRFARWRSAAAESRQRHHIGSLVLRSWDSKCDVVQRRIRLGGQSSSVNVEEGYVSLARRKMRRPTLDCSWQAFNRD
jgi:hypothetical protein